MREIKFRAWIYKFDDEECDREMCYDLFWEDFDAPLNDKLAEIENLMQYTGLKDKNGKEIYEGDILSPNIREVVWHDGFMGDGSGWHTKSHHKDYCGDPWTFGQTQAEVSEIIGNIYETGERYSVR